MLLSLSWLREFTPYDGTAEALGDKLTMLGLELEEMHNPYADLAHITTGHVLSCEKHPNSDHLHCCRVDVGGEAVLDIVCGAPNVARGQKVAVATIGTKLPDGTVIKKSKLRGELSLGMICSERELGLSQDHTGIMVLDPDTQVGRPLTEVLSLDGDILDLSITPNRADCLSVLGLARETAMAFHLPLTIPEIASTATKSAEAALPVHIEDPSLCMLYSGRRIHNISVVPSPLKIRQRLSACGIRPISNIVDVTNYILLECGQPLHAFDLAMLRGQKIFVRRAKEGEHFVTLDGQERILTARDLCICDNERIVALAGVMGGMDSEITEQTKSVFLESAVFAPAAIRKTSRRLGLSSESSFRFERGIDQKRSLWALNRACAMIQQLTGATVEEQVSCSEPQPFVAAKIQYHPTRADALLGIDLGATFARTVFQSLGCSVTEKEDFWEVEQPSWRPDITREADLVEEVGRVYGLDNIPPALPAVAFALDRAGRLPSSYPFWQRIRHWGCGLGLHEVINYSFVGEKDLDFLHLPQEGRIKIMNPLSAEQNVLRTHLAPGLLQNLRTNLAQQAPSIRLFELAHVFEQDVTEETSTKERSRLGILLAGLRHDNIWPYGEEYLSYADLRGIVEHMVAHFHLGSCTFEQQDSHPYLTPCVAVSLEGTFLGVLGKVERSIAEAYLAHGEVWLAELDLDLLEQRQAKAQVHFANLALYPAVKRDITVIGSSTLAVGRVLESIKAHASSLLEDVAFVSVFTPEGTGEKHLSFRLTFRHSARTLKDSEVEKERNALVQALVADLGVRI